MKAISTTTQNADYQRKTILFGGLFSGGTLLHRIGL
jgi:hypothetical protein